MLRSTRGFILVQSNIITNYYQMNGVARVICQAVMTPPPHSIPPHPNADPTPTPRVLSQETGN